MSKWTVVAASALLGAGLLAAITGCWLESPPPVKYYDLVADDRLEPVPSAIQVGEFENVSPSGNRIVLRQSDGSMLEIAEHKWVQEPGELVARRLNNFFFCDQGTTGYAALRGRLTEFTVDVKRREFELDGSYEITFADRRSMRRDFRIRRGFAEHNSQAWTLAASQAVADLALLIRNDLTAPPVDGE